MKFHKDIIFIIGHDCCMKLIGGYCLCFGGGLVTEKNVELAINHEVIHCLLNELEIDSDTLDNVWYMYPGKEKLINFLNDCKECGIGY